MVDIMYSLFLILALFSVADSCLGPNYGQKQIDYHNPMKRPPCEALEIVSRDRWTDRKPKSRSSISGPVSHVFIHHVGVPEDQCYSDDTDLRCARLLKGIQNYHMDVNGYYDIAYSFLIDSNGVVYEGRGWNTEGGHTCGFNKQSYAICFIGNFMDALPDKLALKAAKNLIACGQENNTIASSYALHGHRDADTTSCPGDKLYNDINSKRLAQWLTFNNKQIIDGDKGCTQVRGVCQCEGKECLGQYEAGLCIGDSRRKCCIPKASDELTTPTMDPKISTVEPKTTVMQPQQDADLKCTHACGVCQSKDEGCSSHYKPGLCTGDSNRMCCIPKVSIEFTTPAPTGTQSTQVVSQLNLDQDKLEQLKTRLILDEDMQCVIYKDTVDKLTFGIGHLIGPKDPEYGEEEGTLVTRERVEEAFKKDIQSVLKDVFIWSNDCNQWPAEVKQIISNMMFNMGRPSMDEFVNFK